jgi:hypothetical protein
MARPRLVPTAVIVGPRFGRRIGENSTSPAASAPVAVPVAMPCTTRARMSAPTPPAVQKITVPTAATRREAISTGRRPRWSLSDPAVSRAPSNPATYTAKTTVRTVTEKTQRRRYRG